MFQTENINEKMDKFLDHHQEKEQQTKKKLQMFENDLFGTREMQKTYDSQLQKQQRMHENLQQAFKRNNESFYSLKLDTAKLNDSNLKQTKKLAEQINADVLKMKFTASHSLKEVK